MTDFSQSVVRRSSIPPSASDPVVTPLWPSVVYRTTDADQLDQIYDGQDPGYTYARERHPNADVLAAKLDWMEGLSAGLITGSGMAALAAVLFGLVGEGDHVVVGDQLYGGTRRLLDHLSRLGVRSTLAEAGDTSAIGDETTVVLAEVVSNPTLRIADIERLAAAAHHHQAILVVDNTFTTPRMFQPLQWGADIVVHSLTKFLAGHADVTLGYVGTADPTLIEPIRAVAVDVGLTPSPFDCWLAERGLHTFELRYDRAEATAAVLADRLVELDGIEAVTYPGRSDHPDRAVAKRLFGTRSGNLVSFELRGGREAVNRLATAAAQIPFAPTLGDVATTIAHPASSSHRSLSPEARAALGISEGLLRVSVGIEDTDQLVSEICAAVAAAG